MAIAFFGFDVDRSSHSQMAFALKKTPSAGDLDKTLKSLPGKKVGVATKGFLSPKLKLLTTFLAAKPGFFPICYQHS
jgi:hypothetical protein